MPSANVLADFVRDLAHDLPPRSNLFHTTLETPEDATGEPLSLSVALLFTQSSTRDVRSFMNHIATPAGGSHLQGFNDAIALALRTAHIPRELRTTLRQRMVAVIHAIHPHSVWAGCTKSRIDMPALRGTIRDLLRQPLARWLSNPANLRPLQDASVPPREARVQQISLA